MSPPLAVVADNSALDSSASPARAEAISDRIRRLQNEAKGLAREHIKALEAALLTVERLSAEIAEGGDAYPVGVRELASRIAEDAEHKVQTIEAIASRA
jgi:hypothetical protein